MPGPDTPSATPITLDAFERCAIPLAEWNHRAHLTVAYLYLRSRPFPEALAAIRTGIQTYNAANHIEVTPTGGYHETLTVGWVRILHTIMTVYGPERDAAAFFEQHPYLLNRLLLRLFYSRDRIMSMEARQRFVEPDLAPLPWPPAEAGR